MGVLGEFFHLLGPFSSSFANLQAITSFLRTGAFVSQILRNWADEQIDRRTDRLAEMRSEREIGQEFLHFMGTLKLARKAKMLPVLVP